MKILYICIILLLEPENGEIGGFCFAQIFSRLTIPVYNDRLEIIYCNRPIIVKVLGDTYMVRIFESEYRFMCILWEKEPLASPQLVKECNERLGWKKSTTYTVIKKLTDKGIIKSENTIVQSLVTKEEADRVASNELLERTHQGNVPDFLAAFLKDRKLSQEDVQRIKKLIEEAEE